MSQYDRYNHIDSIQCVYWVISVLPRGVPHCGAFIFPLWWNFSLYMAICQVFTGYLLIFPTSKQFLYTEKSKVFKGSSMLCRSFLPEYSRWYPLYRSAQLHPLYSSQMMTYSDCIFLANWQQWINNEVSLAGLFICAYSVISVLFSHYFTPVNESKYRSAFLVSYKARLPTFMTHPISLPNFMALPLPSPV